MKPCPNCGLSIARRDLHTCTHRIELGRLRDRVRDLEVENAKLAERLERALARRAKLPARYNLPEEQLRREVERLLGLLYATPT